MSTLYKRHNVTTLAEVNALALTDGRENDAYVLGPYGESCTWVQDYATRNEREGHWSYDDSHGGDYLHDGDDVTVLVPIEAEEETVVAVKPGNPYAEASMDSDGNVWFGDGIFTVDATEEFNEWASKNQRTRLVTPWEPA